MPAPQTLRAERMVTRVTPSEHSRLTSFEKLRLGAEILGLYVRARWWLRRQDLPTTLTRLRETREVLALPEDVDNERFVGRALGSITTRTLSVLPADSRCLVRSLVLTGLLSRRGVQAKLVLAVHPGEELAAHAWVEHSGSALIEPGRPPLERLAEL